MRIFHNYSPGIAFQLPFKCGDNPLGSLISGMFGYAGTEDTNETNEDIALSQLQVQMYENQKNRDYNTLEAEKARQFEADQAEIARQFTTSEREAQQQYQQQQWEYQQRNQLALQMQGARDAGINPNVAAGRVMSAQGGSVSAPTGASSPMPGGPIASYSGGLSPVPFQAQNPVMAFATAAQGLASLATAKEKGANVNLIEKQVENMAIDTQYKQVLVDGVKLANKLSKIKLSYADRKEAQELAELIARTSTTENLGELHANTAKIQDSINRLNEALIRKHSQETDILALEVGSYNKRLQQQLKLQGAQIREANARAFEASQNAETTKQLRSWQVGFQQARTELAQVESFVNRNTMWEQCEGKLAELRAKKMLPDQLDQEIRNAKKRNDWYEINELLGIVDTGVKAYGAYYGAKTGQGFVNSQDVQNSITHEYNAWKMSQGSQPGKTYDARNGYHGPYR